MVTGGLIVKIKKTFPQFEIDLEFSCAPCITAITGESGSGKSTILKCVAGLTKPDQGSISCGEKVFFDSERKICLPPGQRRCAYVLQNLGLFPHLSVAENICYGIDHFPRAAQNKRLNELLEMVKLPGVEKRRISELSGGQLQRVAIARALAPEPSLLLMDEPFASLDLNLKEQLSAEMKTLQARLKIPFLLVTHSRQEALELAEEAIVLSHGKIVLSGKTQSVMFESMNYGMNESAQMSW
jgi:molybdate transport system ATP-binding protein